MTTNRIKHTRAFMAKNNIDVSWVEVRQLLNTVPALSSNAFITNIEKFEIALESELSYFTDAKELA